MLYAVLDASALAKRYAPEPGSAVVDHLFRRVSSPQMVVLSIGLAETISVLRRKCNAGILTPSEYATAARTVRSEIGLASPVQVVSIDDRLADRSLELIDRHSINSTDAVLLRSAMDISDDLRGLGHDLVVVASDQRLIRAAQAEGVETFDPEVQTAADLDTLLGPPSAAP